MIENFTLDVTVFKMLFLNAKCYYEELELTIGLPNENPTMPAQGSLQEARLKLS